MTGEMSSINQDGLDSNGDVWSIHAAIAKAVGAFDCPECGTEFSGTDQAELTMITNNGKCYACFETWRQGEKEDEIV